MRRIFTPLALLALLTFSAKAQQQSIPADQVYGKVDNADLEMKACEFEKDANAETLIDKADLYYDNTFKIAMDYHERIKIFNDNGKDAANIHLRYYSHDQYEYINQLQAETINLTDGKIEITKLDKKQIFTHVIDKYYSELVFTMPNVKPGCIIDYRYIWNTTGPDNIPTWYFQSESRPTRYSEISTAIPEYFIFSAHMRTLEPLAANTSTTTSGTIGSGADLISYNVYNSKKVMVNIPSLHDEPYMSSSFDNLQSISYDLASFRPPYGFTQNFSSTWQKIGEELVESEDFGGQFKRKLANEDAIINAAKALKSDDEKIAYIFYAVRNKMKRDGGDRWFTLDGTAEAWAKSSGNATEINLILYHLLKKAGISNAIPMLISTRDNGKVNPVFISSSQFNRAVVYIPVDSTKTYVLDASGKYNIYNEIPYNMLNSSGLYFNMDTKSYGLIFLQKTDPVRQSVYINAEIKPDGKVKGTAQISSFSYNRIDGVERYKTDGEKKYIEYLTDEDNNLKISSLKVDNMDVDSLPLIQNINFDLDLSGSDDYIYFDPNLFTSLYKNPFLNDNRTTNIDFGYARNLALNGVYKIPAGYKVDALPKNITMSMPDKSIIFRRIIIEDSGNLAVRYSIIYKKTIYFKEDYADFHEFFKKLYEMLNEQIVLKKS